MANMERVAEFSHRVEAELARASLESEGIPALLVGDDAGGTYAGLLPVYLLVQSSDLEPAREILEPMYPGDGHSADGPLTDGLPWWATSGLVLALLVAVGMLVLTLAH
jgi:hypothetical protein